MMANDFTPEDAIDHKNRSMRLSNNISGAANGISFCFEALDSESRTQEQKNRKDVVALLFSSLEASEREEVMKTIASVSFKGDETFDADDVVNQTKFAFYKTTLD